MTLTYYSFYRSCRMLALLMLFVTELQAQTTTVRGSVDSSFLSESKRIRAFIYEDLITYAEKDLAAAGLSDKGGFELSFDVKEPLRIFLEVDNARAEMIAEPGKNYEVLVLPRDSQAVNVMGIPVPVGLEFLNSGDRELNYLLADFTGRYESFIEDHRGMVTKKDPAFLGKLDTIKGLFRNKYSAYQNPYLDRHVEYVFAQMEDAVTTRGKERLFKRYINGRAVLPNHPEYMAYFHQYYTIYSERIMNSDKMQVEVNSKMSFASFELLFKQSPYILTDSIREMVMLKSLSEYSKYPHLKKSGILALLEQSSRFMTTAYGKQLAARLYTRISVMAEGSQAPTTVLLRPDGKTATLQDFKGKHIYLTFWSTGSASSLRELSLIPNLKKLFGGRVIFISICLDKSPEQMQSFLKKHPDYDWVFLYFDDVRKARKDFGIISVPSYYLIGQGGKVLRSPAPGPEEAEPLLLKVKKKQL